MTRVYWTAKLLVVLIYSLCFFANSVQPVFAEEKFPHAIQIAAPDGLSTKIRSAPSETAEIIGITLHGDILEAGEPKDGYIPVIIPSSRNTGFVLASHTKPWSAPLPKGLPRYVVVLIIVAAVVIVAMGGIVIWSRAKRTQEAVQQAASIPAAIRRAEELFRSGDYDIAIKEFNSYLRLQGGDVRNPDVYRRLAVCYQHVGEIPRAAKAWEKMRSLGGLKTVDDYTLGVEIMSAQGRELEAAGILEQLLDNESDEDKQYEIRRKLFDMYRRIKEAGDLVRHAVVLLGESSGDRGTVLSDTVSFLMAEGQTDRAIESNNREIIRTICEEYLEDKSRNPGAARIYQKSLEYDPKDLRLHKALAEVYSRAGDVRRAVSELTILSSLDKEQADQYMEQAARQYVENSMVLDAVSEGNPLIIKKIAQVFLARSEVTPDAVAVYEKVLELQPRAVGINKMLSTVYLTKGELDKYMARLRLLNEIDGHNHDYLTDLAQCIIDNELIDETIREGNRDLNARILKQLIKKGAYNDKAVFLFEKLLKHEPGNILLRGALANAYERRQDHGNHLTQLIALAALKPEDDDLVEKTAAMAIEHSMLDQVIHEATPRLLQVTAVRLLEQKKADLPYSRELLEEAVRQNPTNKALRDSAATGEPSPTLRAQPPARKKSQTTREIVFKAPVQPVSAPPAETPPEPVRKEPTRSEPARPAPTAKEEKPPRQPEPVKPPPSAPVPKPAPPLQRDQAKPAEPAPPNGPAQAAAAPQRPAGQFVSLTDPDVPFEEKALTTFVSGYDKGVTYYRPEELFVPATGGLAYKDLEILSEDGWGSFRLGIEVNTGRKILLRVFAKDLLDYSWMKDFVTEVTNLAYSMANDGILAVEESVTSPAGLSGLVHPYFPYTLEKAFKAGLKPDVSHALKMISLIMDALAYAHQYQGRDGKLRRTYHLHLQPSQIVVSQDFSQCRVASLGYSQIFRNLTRGTRSWWQEPAMNPATMPPEFFRSKGTGVKERSAEIYSLGILMHLIVAGEYPFEGPAFDDYKFQHTKIFPAPPRLMNPQVPDWMEPIILGCLEKDPEKRWDSVAEIQQAFLKGVKLVP